MQSNLVKEGTEQEADNIAANLGISFERSEALDRVANIAADRIQQTKMSADVNYYLAFEWFEAQAKNMNELCYLIYMFSASNAYHVMKHTLRASTVRDFINFLTTK